MTARSKAFFYHLAASAVIALLVMGVVFGLWYPAPLHRALGVTDIFLLLLLVDVVVGPVLTLLVFKVGKKTLVQDLAIILALQLGALAYGVWTVAEGRPAWLVFNSDRFDVVQVVDIDMRRVEQAAAEYRDPSWLGPRWVAAIAPESGEQRSEIFFEAVSGGSDIAQRPYLYWPLEQQIDSLRARARPLSELLRYNEEAACARAFAEWPDADVWVPLMARAKPMVVLLRKQTAEVVAVVDLNPWE